MSKQSSRHTLWFWRISVRAAPGREAVGPVVLVGQQRRPFPVRHRSRRAPAARKRPLGRVCAPGESARSPVRGFWRSRWGDFSPGARRFGVLTSTWHGENTEGGSETTKTSVTWRGSESRLWWTARSANQRARVGMGGAKDGVWSDGLFDSSGRVPIHVRSVLPGVCTFFSSEGNKG